MRLVTAFLSLVVAATTVIAQTAPPTQPAASDALTILRQVSQKYADAKSLHLEATEEMKYSKNDLNGGWSKMMFSATVAPNNHYRYEGRGASGTALLVSDGKTIWTYHYNENLFTQKPFDMEKPARLLISGTVEDAVRMAKGLPHGLGRLAERLNSAELLPQQTLTVDGKQYRCLGIHYRTADLKNKDVTEPEGLHRETTDDGTYWIDRDRMVIVKIERHTASITTRAGSMMRDAYENDIVQTFKTVELNLTIPDSSFVFQPPAQAKLVDEFPSEKRLELQRRALAVVEEKENAELIGKPAPTVELKSEDGKVVSLSSYRGKPVFIDVWATWCGPCVAMVPELKRLNSDLSAHGVVVLSVDVADDPGAAAKLLKGEDINWQNLHDAGDTMRSAFHASSAVPWQVFIDSDGNLAFYHFGEDVVTLREAIAALGPKYSSIAAVTSEKPH